MSTPIELWKKWEGRVVDEKFPLRQWLGGTDHSAVFLTERTGSQKAAIKLIAAEKMERDNVYRAQLKDEAQLSDWNAVAKLSHPHLMRLFECGRCQIDDTRLLYVAMECAEENLAEILPLRALSADAAREMLQPAAEALAFLHRAGRVHGRIKPSNIMAVDNQLRVSADGLGKTGDLGEGNAGSAYDAPEVATGGLSAAADVWSLGLTLLAVLNQKELTLKSGNRGAVAVPEAIPQPLREIARQCLEVDPGQRCTAGDILDRLRTRAVATEVPRSVAAAAAHRSQGRSKRWILVPVIAGTLLLVAVVGGRYIGRPPTIPAAENRSASQSSSEVPAAQSATPFATPQTPVQKATTRGSVVQQVMPEVSRSAQNTITGRVKVSVLVAVDASGNVTQGKLKSAGPSSYFASRALAAARRWKFKPPLVQGKATDSEWILKFQFGRTATQVFPAEVSP